MRLQTQEGCELCVIENPFLKKQIILHKPNLKSFCKMNRVKSVEKENKDVAERNDWKLKS